jgi:UDP-2-acetamido-2-deoxy-ribo-hexuluronate aminotransferase
LTDNRDYIQNKLSKSGIPTAIYYPIPINEQMGYKEICRSNATPNAKQLSKKIMSLPMSPYIEEEIQTTIINDLISK